MSASLPILALRVAVIRRQAQALITSLAAASVQRAFSQLEWDENLHPRGAHGRFIGGGGMKAEREAYHLEHALKAFERKTAGMSDAQRHEAGEQMRWRGHAGMKAILTHLGTLRSTADAEAHTLPHDPNTIHELRLLRDEYQLRLAQANRTDASRLRMQREIRIIDRYLARAGMGLPEPGHVPYNVAKAIRNQIDQGLTQEETRARPSTEGNHAASDLATSHRDETATTDALGIAPPTAADLAAMRERGGVQATYAREWPMFALRIQSAPRSKVGDGAVLAPQAELPRKGAEAERERRADNPLYRSLMEKGEITFTDKDGRTLTMRRRWDLRSQKVMYDVFQGDSARPLKGYANLPADRWTPQTVADYLAETAAG